MPEENMFEFNMEEIGQIDDADITAKCGGCDGCGKPGCSKCGDEV